jgi:hypothetical protein
LNYPAPGSKPGSKAVAGGWKEGFWQKRAFFDENRAKSAVPVGKVTVTFAEVAAACGAFRRRLTLGWRITALSLRIPRVAAWLRSVSSGICCQPLRLRSVIFGNGAFPGDCGALPPEFVSRLGNFFGGGSGFLRGWVNFSSKNQACGAGGFILRRAHV